MSGWTDKTTAEVRRQACMKIAVQIVGPAPAKITDAYKKKFLEVVDWLWQDIEDCQPVLVDTPSESATIEPSTNGGTLTLDQAIELTDWLREQANADPRVVQLTQMALVSLGVKSKNLDEAVSQLNQEQADKLKLTIEQGIN